MAGEAVLPHIKKAPHAGFLGVMRNRNYALLWSGQLVSELGNRFHWVAVSLWIFALTRSAAAVSIAISSMFVGGLLVSLWAGPLVDRWNRRTILVASDVARAALVAIIPWLVSVNLWLVYLDLALISVATAFFRPAILALLPQLVSRQGILQANSFFNAMDTGTEIVGPILAGVIAQIAGYAPLLYADAATYLVSAVCILSIRSPGVNPAPRERLTFKVIWGSAVEGWHYLRGDRLQAGLFILIFPAAVVGSGLNALQTPLAKGVVQITDAQFGLFQGVWGIGFVVASLLLGWFGSDMRRSTIMLTGFLVAFVSTGLMGASSALEGLLLTAFLVGFANTLYYVATTTILMEYTPETMLGRVVSTRQFAISLVRVLAPLILGGIAVLIGTRGAILGMSLFGLAATALVVLWRPVIWNFDTKGVMLGSPLSHVWNLVSGPVHPDYDPSQQRRLSFVLVMVVLVAVFSLTMRAPVAAMVAVGAIGFLLGVGWIVKRVGWKT